MKSNIIKSMGVFMIISMMTIVYSSFNTNTYIDGKAYIRVNTDIRITNIEMIEVSGGG